MTQLQQAKQELKQYSKQVKQQFKDDKPAIRACLNDYTDSLCRSGNLTTYQQNCLHNFCCTLHPKK
jgi:hypothetical protein